MVASAILFNPRTTLRAAFGMCLDCRLGCFLFALPLRSLLCSIKFCLPLSLRLGFYYLLASAFRLLSTCESFGRPAFLLRLLLTCKSFGHPAVLLGACPFGLDGRPYALLLGLRLLLRNFIRTPLLHVLYGIFVATYCVCKLAVSTLLRGLLMCKAFGSGLLPKHTEQERS